MEVNGPLGESDTTTSECYEKIKNRLLGVIFCVSSQIVEEEICSLKMWIGVLKWV